MAEFLRDLNATQAAVRAGYSEKTAYSQGHDLLKKPEIAAAIQEEQQKQLGKLDLTAERVLREIAALAFSNAVKVRRLEGEEVETLDQLDEDTQRAIAHIETVQRNIAGGDGHSDLIHKIRLWDKPKALEMLAKHFALLVERQEHSGDVTFRWSDE